MPRVKNWQIGREMSYPYEARFPRRQFAFVFNINRCIACLELLGVRVARGKARCSR